MKEQMAVKFADFGCKGMTRCHTEERMFHRSTPIRLTTLLAPWLLVVVASAGHALAQNKEPNRKERELATQEFMQCVEIEKMGDATACWKLWLTKHESTGSIAEVMFAKERAGRAPQNPGGVAQSPTVAAAAQAPPTHPVPASSSEADQKVNDEFDRQLAEAMGESPPQSVEPPNAKPPPEPEIPKSQVPSAPASETAHAGAEKSVKPTPGAGQGESAATPERHSRTGFSIQPQFAVAATFNNFGRTNLTRSDGTSEFGLRAPQAAVGGGLVVGYDLSRALRWSDTHVRASYSYLHGTNGIEMSASLMPIDVGLEKGFVASSRLLWYAAAGWTGTIINVKVLPSPAGLGPTGRLSSFAWGGVFRAGIDFYMAPSLSLRAELFTRLNLFGGQYKASQKDPMLADFDRRQDYFNQFGLALGVNWTL
jgi:hypothetical protein